MAWVKKSVIVWGMFQPERESGVVGGMLQPGWESLELLGACYSQCGNVWHCWGHVTTSVGKS